MKFKFIKESDEPREKLNDREIATAYLLTLKEKEENIH